MADGPVLITGGAGFIGSTLARQLVERGREVVALDVKPLGEEARFILGASGDGVTYERGSIDDHAAVFRVVARHRPRHIVHVAAITNPVALKSQAGLALRVNVEGTLNVLEAARLFDVERVLYFSSIGALSSVKYEPIDGDHPVIRAREGSGSEFYGASKVAAEAFALAFNSSYGLDVRIIRPSAVYGFGMQWPIYVKPIVEGAVRGEPVSIPHGAPFPRDYTHAEDVAGLSVAVLEGPDDADRLFYGATGEPLRTAGDVAQIVGELVPGAQIEIGDGLSEDDALEIRYRGRLSIENAERQLDWHPRFRLLRDGLEHYVERYRAFREAGGGRP